MPHVALALAADIIDIRHLVLRSGQPRESAHFQCDADPRTFHLMVHHGDDIPLGCVTLSPDDTSDPPSWQLRGMAVLATHRKTGLGRLLLNAAEEIVRGKPGASRMWCNAREAAVGFYRCQGWVTVGDSFELPRGGVHFRMEKKLAT